MFSTYSMFSMFFYVFYVFLCFLCILFFLCFSMFFYVFYVFYVFLCFLCRFSMFSIFSRGWWPKIINIGSFTNPLYFSQVNSTHRPMNRTHLHSMHKETWNIYRRGATFHLYTGKNKIYIEALTQVTLFHS